MSDDHLPQGIPVADVSTPPVCGDCVHCMPGPNTTNNVLSRNCYRFPPTAFGVITQQGVAVVSARPEIQTNTLACGEFEPPEDDVPVELTS